MKESLAASASGVLEAIFRSYDGPPFAIRLWDKQTWNSSPGEIPASTITISTPKALRLLMMNPSQVRLGEEYLEKEIDVEGDLFAVFEAIEHLLQRPRALRERVMQGLLAGGHALAQGRMHSRGRDRASIEYHYDQPPEFFRPWLGPALVYSCAYFQDDGDTLDSAQEQKLDLICRKLRLQPGERFLDIGCGWGSLILHAAGRKGAEAEGITLSREQARVTEQRIAVSGLADRCRVRLQDYRELNPAQKTYDKIASVGMSEHVGLQNLPQYFERAYRLLKPGGVFLNHAIARSAHSMPLGNDSFIARYVFPDGHLVTLTETIAAAEEAGFEVRDVENLREHYERTLRCWVEALRCNRMALLQRVTEKTYRIWLLYMAGCAAAFRRGDIAIYQVLLSRAAAGNCHLPMTREDLYLGQQGRGRDATRPLRPVAMAGGLN